MNTPNTVDDALEAEIRASFKERRRIVLRGTSSYCYQAIVKALPGVDIIQLDLSKVRTEFDLERMAQSTLNSKSTLRNALWELDEVARKRPILLVVTNLDAVAGADEESGIVGRLRGEVQGVHYARVFYTAINNDFLARVLAHPEGSFFKQAVIVDT